MGAPAIYNHPPNRRRSCSSPALHSTSAKFEKHLKVAIDDDKTAMNGSPLAPGLFDKLRTPFTGQIPRAKSTRWNPFARKSRGILGVIHAQTKKNRVVSKHGRLNTVRPSDEGVENHRYLKDFFSSVLDLAWAWTLLGFASAFLLSWLLFAGVWYLLVLLHGDLAPVRPPGHRMCVENIHDFTSCFLFSLETQHTIGYGVRATTEECPLAVLLMSLQSIVGVVIQACMAGIVFAKFTKPTSRAETLMFSKHALVTMRNGVFFLICRIGDLRPTHLLESHVSGQMLKKEETEEGEAIPYCLESMDFGTEIDGSQDFFQMFWPTVVAHKIDDESPLWEFSARNIASQTFEIILTLEGITPETGNTIQVRTSYLPNEILWGFRFAHTCVAYDKGLAKYVVNTANLNATEADRTPRCSPKAWYESQKAAAESAAVEAVLGEVEELTSGVVEELVSEVLLSPLTLLGEEEEHKTQVNGGCRVARESVGEGVRLSGSVHTLV